MNSLIKKINSLFTIELNVNKYKNYLFENIANMLAAGIDIDTILESLEHETKSANVQKLINKLRLRVENGEQLWKIFKEEKYIGDHLIALIQIGEQTGNLPKNLKTVVKYLQRDNEFSNKIKSASLYPSFVLTLLIIVVMVMVGFVLPRLTTIYKSLNVELPTITKILIAVGDFFDKYGVIAVPLFIFLLLFTIYTLFINKKTKHIGDSILFRVPILKNVLMETEITRFGYLLNNLFETGISPSESLLLLANATSFRSYKKLYTDMGILIDKGYKFSEIFYNDKRVRRMLPLYAREMVIVGEKTGKLPENFLLIGETFEKRNEVSLKDAGVIFEPILIIIIWAGIAFVAVAVILPLYNIVGNISSLTTDGIQPASIEQPPTENVINNPDLIEDTPSTVEQDLIIIDDEPIE